MPDVREQARQVSLQGFRGIDDGLQARVRSPEVPAPEELQGPGLGSVAPELPERLLDGPGPSGLEVRMPQRPEGVPLDVAPVFGVAKPCVPASREDAIARPGELPVFLSPHHVHGLSEIRRGMVPVVHDVRAGQDPFRGRHERLPHVHGHGLDRISLRIGNPPQQFGRGLLRPLRYQVENPAPTDVREE